MWWKIYHDLEGTLSLFAEEAWSRLGDGMARCGLLERELIQALALALSVILKE